MSTSPDAEAVRQWVTELAEPHTRRKARYRLVAARAADALVGCLSSINESVVWAAVQSLGELRAREAVDPLIELLQRDVLMLDVAEALARITGHDFGTDAAAWKRWAAEHEETESTEQDRLELLKEANAFLESELRGRGNTYEFRLSLDGGRQQKVIIKFGRLDAEGDELAVVYSECGPAKARHYEAVLRKNVKIPAGAFAIRDVKGVATLVLVDTLPLETLTAQQLAKSVANIAARADLVEKGLTGEDTR